MTVGVALKMDLPTDWFSFQPASRDDERLIADAVANLHRSLRKSGHAEQMVSLEMVESAVRHTFTQLAREDVGLAGVCVKPVSVDGADRAVSASMTAAVRPLDGALSLDDVQAVLDEVGAASRSLYANADFGQSLVTVGGVDALRMSWRSSQLSPWSGITQPCRILQFVVPLREPGVIVVVTFETTSWEFFEAMTPVFEGIAATLETVPSGGRA
jgi:hypothetical protein